MINLLNNKNKQSILHNFLFFLKKKHSKFLNKDCSLAQDYIDLFSGTRKAHMAKYVYMFRPEIYEEILKQDSYYPFQMERDLLLYRSEEICKNFQNVKHVLELGPGSSTAILSKTVPFLKVLQSQATFFSYKAIDSTLEYAQHACQVIGKHFQHIRTQPLEIDFLSLNAFHPFKKEKDDQKLFLSFGQTVFANNNDEAIRVLLENISNFLNPKDYILFGIDTPQNEKCLEAAYNIKPIEQLLLNSMYYLKFKLNLENFNPEAFKLTYKWNSQERAVVLSLMATTTQTLHIENKKLIINKGQEFNIMNSRKPSLHIIEKLLSEAGIKIHNVIDDSKDKKFSFVIAKK